MKDKQAEQEEILRDKFALEEVSVGGNAPLIDAFILLIRNFKKDRVSGMNIMARLLPKQGDSTRQEFIMYVMAAKMQQSGKSPAEIF